MSPIPKAPKAKSPIQKAIEAMLEQAAKGTMPLPTAVNIYPQDLISTAKPDGPLTKAWREHAEQMKRGERAMALLSSGRTVTGITYDEAGSSLLKDLEDSLWAMATLHTSVFTREMLLSHVGPGHMEDDWYVKRLYPTEVHLLCKCQTILVLSRCMYCFDEPVEFNEQCENIAYPVEGALRRDVRCVDHVGTQKGKT